MTPANDAFIDHLNNGQNCCFAPNDRYCEAGRELWLEDKVQAVLAETSLSARRYLLEQMARNIPQWLDEIKRRAAEQFEVRKHRRAA